MTKKSVESACKGIDYAAPMPDNEEAAITSGPQPAQTETGIIFRTRPSGVLTRRVRILGGGGGGRARGAGPAKRGEGAGFFAFLPGSGGEQGLDQGWNRGLPVGSEDAAIVHDTRKARPERVDQGFDRWDSGMHGQGCLRRSVGGRSAPPPCSSGRTIRLTCAGHLRLSNPRTFLNYGQSEDWKMDDYPHCE